MIYVTDLTYRLNLTGYILVKQAPLSIHDTWEMLQGVVYKTTQLFLAAISENK
jgi:hypothetical protein